MSFKLNFTLDEWQEEILRQKGNILLMSGRQVGKSTIISIKAGEFAANNKDKTILVISSVERQAYLLFEKILSYLYDNYKSYIKKGKDRPTKSKIKLNNGSVIHCLPTGLSGTGIRGYTVDLLIADEAAFIPEEVWVAVSPMLALTGGDIWLLSTPHGNEGYFIDCLEDPNFTKFYKSTEEILKIKTRLAKQLEDLKNKLEHDKKRMTRLEYAQEYLGQPLSELKQFFPDDLIKQVCVLGRSPARPNRKYFLGVDVARMGGDESTFEIIDRTNKEMLFQVENEVTSKTLTTQTTEKVLELERKYNFKKIYIDDGGLGVGVFDQLLKEKSTRRKVIPINNASRDLDRDGKKKKRLLKEDLYNNLKRLMEREEIQLLNDEDLKLSLKSIQMEYTNEGKLKIHGKYAHITEGLIRAVWCAKDKSLNIYRY